MVRDFVTILVVLFTVPVTVSRTVAAEADGSNKPALQRYAASQVHMGTLFQVVFYADDLQSATLASEAAFQRIARLDSMLSDYLDDSELTRLSESAGGPPIPVSNDLFAVLAKSVRLSEQTNGAFDITIGPVVRLWRRARRQQRLPDREQIHDYLERTGYQKIKLDHEKQTIQLLASKMRLDLGGIAKGYACEQALKVLAEHGIERALVDGGGDLAVSDPPPGKEGWAVHRHPYDDKNAPALLLCNEAAATSGDATQFVEIDGVRYSHIVDPKTGLGLTNRVQVTVIAPDGSTADALASAISVLGPDKGIKLADSLGVAVFISQFDGERDVRKFFSQQWQKRFERRNDQ